MDRDEEEPEFLQERKIAKAHRKLLLAKDRSKYKKTDRAKFEKLHEQRRILKLEREDLLHGRVLSILSEGILVETEGERLICTLKGVLKKEKGLAKNLIVVGDCVLLEKKSATEGTIAHVEPRKTLLSRADNLSRRKEQLIAANVDQVIIAASVVDPPLKPFLIDRYIIAAKKGGMECLIAINKIDLLEESVEEKEVIVQERALYRETLLAYETAGIPLISVSTTKGTGLQLLRETMKNKVSVFSGPSGVGKTSLINVVAGMSLRVGKTVEKTKKGAHTTSTAQLLPLPFGGWCIDTPGIKSFGLWDLKKEEIESYFSEIYTMGHHCKFPDCYHLHEAGCAVLKALEEEKISPLRYESYQALIDKSSEAHLRR